MTGVSGFSSLTHDQALDIDDCWNRIGIHGEIGRAHV